MFSIALFMAAAVLGSAAPISYSVAVSTVSISGAAGALDFQFNPGPFGSQSASVQILSFVTDGTLLGPPLSTGDISGGPLPAQLNLHNGMGFNDFFQQLTFASILSFTLSFDGPAISSPEKTSASGSIFVFSLFANSDGTIPILTTDLKNGFAFAIDVNLDGSTTVSNFSEQTIISTINPVPEPTSFSYLLLALPALALVAVKLRRFGAI